MTHQIKGSDNHSSVVSQVELELLAALLEPEDATYPWNPLDNESEAYFIELEEQFARQDMLEEELTSRAQNFYQQLDNLWSQVENSSHYNCNTIAAAVNNLQENLQKVFAAGIPQNWLSAIATKATEIVASQQTLGEQLVECVQAVLPTWEADDLSILARPYAYAMRSHESQNISSVVKPVEDWAALSEIEQAKMGMAIAYYALTQLNTSDAEG
ncbi:hypothetical protein [Nostoc sp. CMAA1605]|uniref:hypothetical protein n=1 Tax=Nostoc sp. CMAA1605 TaxID=2055159 RepID=UPI001F422782|nr:hypothetical protein [Nostoc sp. CMAA1605]MCF4969889.1 hypothetical protein [Nostoc sp. CMAA1605]